MATSIKGLQIRIGGDTTGLSTALRKSDIEIKRTQSDLKDLERALKLDPKNVELLEQKQRLLAQAVDQAAKKVDALKQAQAEANKLLAENKIGQDQYDKLTREIIKAEGALKKAQEASDKFNASMGKAQQTLTKVGDAAGTVAEKTKAASAAAGALLAGMGALALKTAKEADELNTLSQQSGLTTEELQKMQYASELVDVSVSDMASAQSKLRKSMASSEATFNQLGVATRDASGAMRDSSDVFYDVLEALGKVGNETERDQLAMQIFGKSADQLAGIIDDGGAALKAYGDEAERLGLIMDQQTLDSLNKVNDELDQLKAQAKGELAKTGAKALEALTPVIEDIINALSGVLQVIGDLSPEAIEMIAIIAGIVAAISPVAGLISKTTIAVGKLIELWPAIQGAMTTITTFAASHPIGLIIAAIAALTALVIANWDKIKPVLEKAWAKVKEVFENIKEGITAAIDVVKEKINAVIGFINTGIEAVNAFIEKVNGSGVAKALGINIGTMDTIGTLQTSADKSAALLQSGGRTSGATTNNAYNTTNVYNQTSSQPLQVNLNMDGQTLARQMVQPMRAANALAGGTNMR